MIRSSHFKWFSWTPLLPIALIVASPSIGQAQPASSRCPGIPLLCGMTCSPDAFGTPIYCSNGQCTCAPGYETRSGPSGLVCVPTQPEVIGTEARDSGDLDDMKYACSGVCSSDADNRVGGAVPWSPVANACQGGSRSGTTCLSSADCAGTCGPKTTGQCQGGTRDGLSCHDPSDCPGTDARCVAMGFCSGHGGLCESDADCAGQCRVGQQWAFFYRQTGNNGPCGGSSYSRCLSTFKLPLGLPEVPGNGVLTGADVHVDWHAWRMDDSVPTDVNVDSSFDLTNGTVLNITLPHFDEGVVGLVTVTPTLDTTPPQLTCPAPIVVDATGPSGAVVSYAPTASDNCSVTSVACTPPSGTTFAVGDSTVGCTASDTANNATSCSFTIHVKGPAEQTGDLITVVNGLATKSGIRNSLLAKLTAALARLQGGNPADACGPLHAFINEVNAQRGKSISASDADALVAAARQIMVVNGCGP